MARGSYADGPSSPQLDIFSAGVMAAEIMSGRVPNPGPEMVRQGRRRVVVMEEERRADDITAAAEANADICEQVVAMLLIDPI